MQSHTRQAKQKKSLLNSPLSPRGRGLGRGGACYAKKFIQIPYLLISYEQSSY
jgi:hypothetical protein